MAKVVVHIWHKATGQIVVVGRPMAKQKCTGLGRENESVLETEIDEQEIANLYQTHTVDNERKILVKRHSKTKAAHIWPQRLRWFAIKARRSRRRAHDAKQAQGTGVSPATMNRVSSGI